MQGDKHPSFLCHPSCLRFFPPWHFACFSNVLTPLFFSVPPNFLSSFPWGHFLINHVHMSPCVKVGFWGPQTQEGTFPRVILQMRKPRLIERAVEGGMWLTPTHPSDGNTHFTFSGACPDSPVAVKFSALLSELSFSTHLGFQLTTIYVMISLVTSSPARPLAPEGQGPCLMCS